MRMIGQLSNESNAKLFGGYLASLEIKNLVEPEAEGKWAVWIYSEDQLEKARQLLSSFLLNPTDPKFHHAAKAAAAAELRDLKEQKEFAEKIKTRENIWPQRRIGPLTLGLLVLCGFVAAVSQLGTELRWIHSFLISEFINQPKTLNLVEVHSGQVWRLLTPIFIHFGPWHLIFNMLWLKDLGTMIESRQGTGKLAAMIVVIAVLSNLGQYFLSGPLFGGMSGVVYGLFAYIWIRGKCDPDSGLFVDPRNVIMMMIWFFLCFTPIIPNVANTVHTIGLIIGAAWGALPLAKKFLKL